MSQIKTSTYKGKKIAIVKYIGADNSSSYMAMKFAEQKNYVDGNPIICDEETNTIPLSYHEHKDHN
jgi:hypothetical protein